jgi:hypothetical protein
MLFRKFGSFTILLPAAVGIIALTNTLISSLCE